MAKQLSEDLAKRKTKGPFMPKWQKVKGRHKALKSGNLFKTDITKPIDNFDAALKEYDALLAEEQELKNVVKERLSKSSEARTKIDQYTEKLSALTSKSMGALRKDYDALDKYVSGTNCEPATILSTLDDIVSTGDDYVKNRKTYWDGIDEAAKENVELSKKSRDDYKTKSEALLKKVKALEDKAYDCQVKIGLVVAEYVDTADEADHPEIIKDLQGLAKEF